MNLGFIDERKAAQMSFIDKYNCILCKYSKYNKNGGSCFDHQEKDEYGHPIGECKSLSNIYYGVLIKFFPFKQVHDFLTERAWRKEEKYNNEMDEKYFKIAKNRIQDIVV